MARDPITLTQLLAALRGQVEVLEQRGDMSCPVHAITDDSRAVTGGSLFVAVKGERVDGHGFVEQAIKAGAVAVVAQAPVASGPLPFVRVADSRKALGLLGSRFHGDPSARLKMIGVTGTNGKTTTTYLCKALLEGIGRRVGLIGTVGYQIGQETLPAPHTTPGALDLQALLAKMVESGLTAAVMEVSSHALALDRTSGCEYDVAVFTNLTQDHLDFHHTMDEYFEAKLRLFTGLAGGQKAGKRALVNVDDPRGATIRAACPVPVWGYAIQNQADLKAEGVCLSLTGTTFTAATPAGSFHRREPVGRGAQRLQLAGGDRGGAARRGDVRSDLRSDRPYYQCPRSFRAGLFRAGFYRRRRLCPYRRCAPPVADGSPGVEDRSDHYSIRLRW